MAGRAGGGDGGQRVGTLKGRRRGGDWTWTQGVEDSGQNDNHTRSAHSRVLHAAFSFSFLV